MYMAQSIESQLVHGWVNFSMALKQQPYVFQSPMNNTSVSFIHPILSYKTQAYFEEILQAIIDRCDA